MKIYLREQSICCKIKQSTKLTFRNSSEIVSKVYSEKKDCLQKEINQSIGGESLI